MGMDILRQLNRFSEKYWKNNFNFEPGIPNCFIQLIPGK